MALVGHGGAGKTTLAEALLHRAGAINRLGRVEDGSTVCDHEPEEHKRGLSLSLAVAPFEWKGHKVNLVDTPGYADFLGDVLAALRVVDLAVFVVSAVDGVEVQTAAIWREAARLGVPRMVFVNKLDRERASFERTLDQLRAELGAGVAPLELPIGAEADFRGIADLLTDTAHVYVDGVPHTEAIPDDMEALEHRVHDNLVEGIVVAEDALLERYLDGEVPSVPELEHALTLGIESASVFPVVCGSATAEIGVDRLADLLVEIGPPPGDRPTVVGAGDVEVEVAADPDGHALAFTFATIADPFVGQVSLLKVLSGTIRNDDRLVNSRTGVEERLHGLFVVRGREHEPVDARRRVTSAVSPSSWGRPPATRWRPADGPSTWHRSRCHRRCWPLRWCRSPRPTTTSWPPRSTASRRRIRRWWSSGTRRRTRPCCGASARRTSRWRSSGSSASSACGSAPSRCASATARRSRSPASATSTRTRSSRVATASTPASCSPSSRSSGAAASSSSTASWAVPSARASSPRWPRAWRRRWRRAARPATRWSTCASRWSTVRSTVSTATRWPSARRGGRPSRRRSRWLGRCCWSPSRSSTSPSPRSCSAT